MTATASSPFQFDDGDHLGIVLKKEGERWVLSDEGRTYMQLSYFGLDDRDLQRGTRQEIISAALSNFSVQDRDGELLIPVPEERYGDALYSLVQALLKISDVTADIRVQFLLCHAGIGEQSFEVRAFGDLLLDRFQALGDLLGGHRDLLLLHFLLKDGLRHEGIDHLLEVREDKSLEDF